VTVLAGADIGNATTELVLAELRGRELKPLWSGMAPTTGMKGDRKSLEGAARLLQRAERESDRRASQVLIAKLRAVQTQVASAEPRAHASAAVVNLASGEGQTPGGLGMVSGAHRALARLPAEPTSEAVIVSIAASEDFEEAAGRIKAALERGWPIVGALCGGDDAVLIANRVPIELPIVDELDVGQLREGERVALEVAPAGESIRTLADPVGLAAALGLPGTEVASLAAVTRELGDAPAVALVRRDGGRDTAVQTGSWVEFEGEAGPQRLPIVEAARSLSALPPGSARRLWLRESDGRAVPLAVDDAFVVDVERLDDGIWLRRGVIDASGVPLAALVAHGAPASEAALEQIIDRPVNVICEEPAAAAAGAMTTPSSPAGSAVCDIGAGTIDLVAGVSRQTVAGAGQLVTEAVAATLGIPSSTAEYAKRGPAVKIETPHLGRFEDGARRFLDHPAPHPCIGRLCAAGPGGRLPFHSTLAPEEWRGLRLALKREVIGANVERCLAALERTPDSILLAGGGALDEELVRITGEVGRDRRIAVGRANVAGRFGPRFAVAHGLLVLMTSAEEASVAA